MTDTRSFEVWPSTLFVEAWKRQFPWTHWIKILSPRDVTPWADGSGSVASLYVENPFDSAVLGVQCSVSPAYRLGMNRTIGIRNLPDGSNPFRSMVTDITWKLLQTSLKLTPRSIGPRSLSAHSIICDPVLRQCWYRRDWIRQCRQGRYIQMPVAEQLQVYVLPIESTLCAFEVVCRGALIDWTGDPRDYKGD